MPGLTQQQIALISDGVSAEGITFSHLHDELVDHICCMTEDFMAKGLNFDAAYRETIGIIGHKGLKKVQENTILLIDKKYRIMKNTMKIIGWGAMALMTTGALFKIQHWAGAGILLVLGFFLLGAVFIPTALWVMKKESKLKGSIFIFLISIIGSLALIFGFLFKIQHWPGAGILITFGYSFLSGFLLPALLINKLLDPASKQLRLTYVIGYFALSFYAIGTLFKIMHCPGAAIMLILGAILLTAVFFPMYVSKVYMRSNTVKPGFLFMAVGLVFFNMFSLLLAMNVSRDVMRYFVKPGNGITQSQAALTELNKKQTVYICADSLSAHDTLNSDIKKLSVEADALCAFIDTIKTEIVMASDGISESNARSAVSNTALIIDKGSVSAPASVLFGLDGNAGRIASLKEKINHYLNTLTPVCKNNRDALSLISNALSTGNIYSDYFEKEISWETHLFYQKITIAVLNTLSNTSMRVRIAENAALNCLN